MFPIDLLTADLGTIIQALDNGIITSEQLVKEYIDRISRDNIHGHGFRAVLEMVPEQDCLHAGRMADETRQSGRKSLLHGIPILIKGSIATGPEMGLKTTSGTPALNQSVPFENAPVVASLLPAGMIILGKANLTILSNFFDRGTPNGWSPLGGQVRSPFGPDVNPGGSSTGSAVALAVGMCAATIGAETVGSVTCPANHNGLWGIKPTPGSVSNAGVVPISPMFETVGPFGKSVDDLAYLLDILIPNQDYRSKFHSGLSTLSIGIGGPANHTLEEQNLYRKAQDCLASGDKVHIVAHEIQFNLLQQATSENSAVTIMSAGLERAMGEYLTGVSGPIRTLRDIVNWHSMHPTQSFCPTNPGQSNLEDALHPPTSALNDAIALSTLLTADFHKLMDSKNLDVMMYPWGASAPTLASLAGLPICTAPFKLRADGAPFGVLFVARPGAEVTLLRVMAACEQVFPSRPIPILAEV